MTRSSRAASSAATGARGIAAGSAARGLARRFGAEHVLLHDAAVAAGRLDVLAGEAAVGHQLLRRGGVLDVAPRGGGLGGAGGGGRRGLARRGPGLRRPAATDPAELAAGLDRGAGLGVDLAERAGGRGGNLDRDLVGLELAEHLVLHDGVADLLEPGGDRRFGDALAECRDHYLDRLLVGRGRFRVLGRGLAGGLLGRLGGLRRLGRRRLRLGLLVDGREERIDSDRLALLGYDLCEDAGGGRRDLDGHLVGLELAEHLVDLDRLADLLEPGGDGRLGDALAERGDADVGHVASGPS